MCSNELDRKIGKEPAGVGRAPGAGGLLKRADVMKV